jgi:hypothetical protein
LPIATWDNRPFCKQPVNWRVGEEAIAVTPARVMLPSARLPTPIDMAKFRPRRACEYLADPLLSLDM